MDFNSPIHVSKGEHLTIKYDKRNLGPKNLKIKYNIQRKRKPSHKNIIPEKDQELLKDPLIVNTDILKEARDRINSNIIHERYVKELASRDFVGGGSSLGDVNSYSGTPIPKWLQKTLGLEVYVVNVDLPEERFILIPNDDLEEFKRKDYAELCRKRRFWEQTLPPCTWNE